LSGSFYQPQAQLSNMNYLDEIFLNARQISNPVERTSYLWDACCGDTDFLERVEAMLCEADGRTPASLIGEPQHSGH
jgi:hypothetical protein